jgi:hypothetical protein
MRCPRAESSAEEPSRGQGEARVLNALEEQTASSGDPASVSWLDALWLSPRWICSTGRIAKHALLHLVLLHRCAIEWYARFQPGFRVKRLTATEASYMSLVIPLVCIGITTNFLELFLLFFMALCR